MFKKNNWIKKGDKVIDIDAGMEGKLAFTTPVNLRINGKFRGELKTKGNLIIGEAADVRVKIIDGENIVILGKVKGNIKCGKHLELSSSAQVTGNIQSPVLVVNKGAALHGNCQVPLDAEKSETKKRELKR
ncbi:MAG: polymer-forming cytoskeletal protein [Candidatus Omnitrophica bacterium]|nr:polymer-forming cytoskeletal protein [Candidatus Omnitrophota bacterium]